MSFPASIGGGRDSSNIEGIKKRKSLSVQELNEVFGSYTTNNNNKGKSSRRKKSRRMNAPPANVQHVRRHDGESKQQSNNDNNNNNASSRDVTSSSLSKLKKKERNAKNLARRKRNKKTQKGKVGDVMIPENNRGEAGDDNHHDNTLHSEQSTEEITGPDNHHTQVGTNQIESTTIGEAIIHRHHHGVPRGKRCVAATVIEQHILRIGRDDRVVDLPKESINSLPNIPYQQTKNAIVVITTAVESDEAVANIRAELRRLTQEGRSTININDNNNTHNFQFVGMDTETRPKYNKGGKEHPPALLQIATPTTAYLFRLAFVQGNRYIHKSINSTMTLSLIALLSDNSIIKVGVGIHSDVNELIRTYGQGTCGDESSYLDLAPLVAIKWPRIRRAGLRNLTATILGYKLSKAQQMKNWECDQLTSAMMAYAAADAFVALDLLAAICSR
jgi:hypothetical protein